MKKCTKCGYGCGATANYCHKCGTKLTESTTKRPQSTQDRRNSDDYYHTTNTIIASPYHCSSGTSYTCNDSSSSSCDSGSCGCD